MRSMKRDDQRPPTIDHAKNKIHPYLHFYLSSKLLSVSIFNNNLLLNDSLFRYIDRNRFRMKNYSRIQIEMIDTNVFRRFCLLIIAMIMISYHLICIDQSCFNLLLYSRHNVYLYEKIVLYSA